MNKRNSRVVVTIAAIAFASLPSAAVAQSVGAAQSFAIVGGQSVTAAGAGSLINGDVGVAPGTSITGFPAGASTVPPYSTHSNDGPAQLAQAATLSLYNSIVALGPGTAIGAQLSAQILGPGVYSIGAADIAMGGNLTLTGAGTYIFKVASSLTANTTSTVTLIGVDPCQVFWQVTAAATLNGVNFVGNVVAQAGVDLGTSSTLVGRALTTSLGAVTLAGNDSVGGCSVLQGTPSPTPTPAPIPVSVPDLVIVKSHQGNFIAGVNATYNLAIFNFGGAATTGPYTITDTLPAGLTAVAATGVGWECTASGQVVTCTSSTVLAPGAPGPNSITLTVRPSDGAVPTVTNRAVVTGGGDAVPTNNTTIDVTVVSPAGTPVPVPTLSEWATIALTMALGLAGLAALRRRRA